METKRTFPFYNLIDRTRRNHALEHATIHILSKRNPGKSFGGYSTFSSVFIQGNVEIEEIAIAIKEAFEKLNMGQKQLAIHPNCGTNFAISGGIAGLVAGLSMLGAGPKFRDKMNRLSWAMMFATIALIVSRPLGPIVQEKYTTNANLGNMEIVHIAKVVDGNVKAYKISTKG